MKERRLKFLAMVLVLVALTYWIRSSLDSSTEEFTRSNNFGVGRFRPAPSKAILSDLDPDKLVQEGPPSLATLFDNHPAPAPKENQATQQRRTDPFITAGHVELVWIPQGVFTIGSPDQEEGRGPSEGPQTEVTISRGFWLSKYELTIGQYRAIMRRAGVNVPPISRRESRKPVVNVSWEDATNFCAHLTALEIDRLPKGYGFRLPTEAEWEYACRAGTSGPINLGDLSNDESIVANVWCASSSRGAPQDVGRKLPNGWGLHDMHGNVAEWVLDVLNPYPAGSLVDPLGTIEPYRKIRRGGSFRSTIDECRSAARMSCGNNGEIDSGFRVALAPLLPLKSEKDVEESTR